MKVDHVTHSTGNSCIRNSIDILPTTRKVIKLFEINNEVKTIDIPYSKLKAIITATFDDGAIFDIMKNGQVITTNFCCFCKEQNNSVMTEIGKCAKMGSSSSVKITKPKTDKFLYSFIINPMAGSIADLMIAGEVEFYIYYSLYLAHENRHGSKKVAS